MKTQLKENEELVMIFYKHWFVLVKPGLISLILLAVVVWGFTTEYSSYFLLGAGVVLLWLGYKIIERNKNLWAVTTHRVIDEFGVFSKNSKETPLEKINNVSFSQPLIGRIFNYGHVKIQSAAERGATTHYMVEKPELLKDSITDNQELYKKKQLMEQAEYFSNSSSNSNNTNTDITEELTKLHDLKEKGIITEEDFQKRKNKLLES